jgi:hypothetical protein
MMHNKNKGTLGELAVAKDLSCKGYGVFKEFGDLSKIDLIAEKDGKLIRIQVKCRTVYRGAVEVDTRKSGPGGYSYRYDKNQVDVFAVYVPSEDKIAYINAANLLDNYKTTMTLRIYPVKNGQKKGVNIFSEFSNFEEALR